MRSVQTLALGLVSFSSSAVASVGRCKATPSDASWPSTHALTALNSSLCGNLIAAKPLAAPCHNRSSATSDRNSYASYDAAACASINSNWASVYIHLGDPTSIAYTGWTNDSCLPSQYANASTSCTLDGLPLYVVNASTTEDVVKGVVFAKTFDLRVVVKNTGHDFLGKSAGGNSLSIWVHHLDSISYSAIFSAKSPSYTCKSNYSGPAFTVGPGVIMQDAYKAADKLGLVIVGGADPTVGFGGFLLGGGHSPISSKYGLGADQVLEITVVTADGQTVVANDCQNSDLFYAMRGGGGGFGVVTSYTVRAYKTPTIQRYFFGVGSTQHTNASIDSFWDTVTYLHQQFPTLNDQGIQGYTFLYPTEAGTAGAPPLMTFIAAFLIPDETLAYVEALFAPIAANIKTRSPNVLMQVADVSNSTSFNAFYTSSPLGTAAAVGNNLGLASRLLNRTILTDHPALFKQQLMKAATVLAGTPYEQYGEVLGHLIAGQNVAKMIGGSNGVNPAWREAYYHVVLSAEWTLTEDAATREGTRQLLTKDLTFRNQALRDLSPSTGCYLNEADVNEPNYQQAFYGLENYQTLLKIKQKYDPTGVFWCKTCVGSEAWKEVNDGTLRLCRA